MALQLSLTPDLPYTALAQRIGLSHGEVHKATKRLGGARLLRPGGRRVVVPGLLEFLVSGVPYAFAATPGAMTRGVPTAHSAPPLASVIVTGEPVVWPSADGTVRGESVEPLYPGAPALVRHNQALYELLALTDALRIGRTRERQLARQLLDERLRLAATT